MGWIQRQMTLGINPEDILAYMVPHTQLVLMIHIQLY